MGAQVQKLSVCGKQKLKKLKGCLLLLKHNNDRDVPAG